MFPYRDILLYGHFVQSSFSGSLNCAGHEPSATYFKQEPSELHLVPLEFEAC